MYHTVNYCGCLRSASKAKKYYFNLFFELLFFLSTAWSADDFYKFRYSLVVTLRVCFSRNWWRFVLFWLFRALKMPLHAFAPPR